MAIGDKPNQNLFGTNDNAEDEERKKAELAAQDAIIGSGIPDLSSNVVAQVPGIQNIRNPGAFDPTNIEPVRPIMSAGTVERVTPNSLVVNKISDVVQGLRDVVGTESVSMEDYQAKQAAQTSPSVSALEATPSVTPPAESLSEGAQGQGMDMNQKAITNALTDQNQGMDMNQQAIANAQGQEATAPLPAQTLSQFMRYEDAPEQRTEQFLDEQGRLRFRPTQEALQLQAQGEVAQPPASALSSFEQDSQARQQRIGGTGSFEGDSQAMQDRLRANERQPGESQTERDTRIAQSKTTGGQTGGMSFDDARRRAEGDLAERGVKNPSASQVNALARALQAEEPERLAALETKRAKDAIELRDAEAKKDFKPQIVEIGDQKLIQLSPNYYQPVRPEPTAEEPFDPRVLEEGGFTYYEVAPNRFERQPSTKAGGAAGEVSSAIADAIAAGGGEVATTPAPTVDTPEVATSDEFTPQQELGIQKVMADNKITREKAIEELRKAGKLK